MKTWNYERWRTRDLLLKLAYQIEKQPPINTVIIPTDAEYIDVEWEDLRWPYIDEIENPMITLFKACADHGVLSSNIKTVEQFMYIFLPHDHMSYTEITIGAPSDLYIKTTQYCYDPIEDQWYVWFSQIQQYMPCAWDQVFGK